MKVVTNAGRVRFFGLIVVVPLLFLVLSLGSCGGESSDDPFGRLSTAGKLVVGVLDAHGGSQSCIWEATEALRLDSGVVVLRTTSAGISDGILEALDALVIPGGGGSRQYLNLGTANHERIKEFVRSGGAVVGICAGAYLLSDTPGYACLHMSGAKAIDIEHDNRGRGIARVTLTEAGKKLFPEVANLDTLSIYYYEGPVYDTVGWESLGVECFAVMESDVHVEGGAPAGMTNGRPFIIGNSYGSGRTVSVVGHPEATPGMRWMIPALVRWACGREPIAYGPQRVRPNLFPQEVLFTDELRTRESALYDTLLYGDSQARISALEWLFQHQSWPAKRWVQGLLYDADPAVRAAAVRYIAGGEYTHYLADLEAAYRAETDPGTKGTIESAIRQLREMVNEDPFRP